MIASVVPATTMSSVLPTRSDSVGLITNLTVDVADPNRANRPIPGDLRERQRRRGADDREDVRVVFLIGGHHRGDDLHFGLVALGKQWPNRSVGQARGEGRRFGWSAFALDESAGNLPRGVHSLFILDRQGKEANGCVRLPLADDGREHSRVAVADDDRAVGLLGDQTCFERERATREIHFHAGNGGAIIAGHYLFLSLDVLGCFSFNDGCQARMQVCRHEELESDHRWR